MVGGFTLAPGLRLAPSKVETHPPSDIMLLLSNYNITIVYYIIQVSMSFKGV